jgi:hypothetical protein
VRQLGSTSEPLEHDRHVHRKSSSLRNFGGQIFYEISTAVCVTDDNPQAPFAAWPSLGVPNEWRRRVIIVQPRPSYGRSSRRAGPAKPTACFAEHLFLAAKQWHFVPASGVSWDRVIAAAKWPTRPLSARMPRRADGLLVGFALVRGLLMSAEHLFLAAKQWLFVPASGVRWDRVSAAKADTVPICTTGVPGCRRLLVALFPVRVLF